MADFTWIIEDCLLTIRADTEVAHIPLSTICGLVRQENALIIYPIAKDMQFVFTGKHLEIDELYKDLLSALAH